MADTLQRGTPNESLPEQAVVLRACRLPLNYEAGQALSRNIFNFSLSSRDKEVPEPKLSVYVKELTTERQASRLVGDGNTHRLIARLAVSLIRQIVVGEYRLNAVWDTALLEDGITPDNRPGANGHAGITGLHRPPHAEKTIFKALQVRLADAVGQNYIVIDDAECTSEPLNE